MTRRAVARAGCVAAALAVSTACAPETRHGGPAWVGQRGPDVVEGTVRVVGNEPFSRAIVEPAEGEPVVIEGPYRGELRRLAGAVVRVTGRLGEAGYPGRGLDASSYEIVSVDGDRPLLGVLGSDEAGFTIASPQGDTTRLAVVSDPLAAQRGALVWVVLDDRGGVARYGVLREPS